MVIDHELDPEIRARFETLRLALSEMEPSVDAKRIVYRDTIMCFAFFATARAQLEAIKQIMPHVIYDLFGIDQMILLMGSAMDSLERAVKDHEEEAG